MPSYAQIPIRFEASIVSNPPVDANTGNPPKLFRGQTAAIQIGIFDADNVAVDLTAVTSLILTLQQAVDSVVPLWKKTITAIVPTITRAAWLAGTAQQAVQILSSADTDQALGGLAQADLFISLVGTFADGSQITYSAGTITIYSAGLTIPLPPFTYVSRNTQTNTAGNATIQPQSGSHTEQMIVAGVARTSQHIVSTVGVANGSILRISYVIPSTSDIIIQLVNAAVDGTLLATFTSGAVLNGLIELVYDGGTWVPLLEVFPAKF